MLDLSTRQGSKLAGYRLLFMFIAGIFASGPQTSASIETILSTPSKLRINIAGNLMMTVFDTVAALGLYILLKPVNKSLSLLSASFRSMHVAIYAASAIFLMYALNQIVDYNSLKETQIDQSPREIISYLRGHEYGFQISTLFFGFHFVIMGYLMTISRYIPRIISIFILIVGLGYLANSYLGILHPNYDNFKTTLPIIIFTPAMLAEFILCLWLILKSNSIPEASIFLTWN